MKEWKAASSALNNGDKAKALALFKDLAEKGIAEALLEIGVIYESGGGGVEVDHSEAFSWYQRSVEKTSDAHSNLALARCYFHGLGVEQNQKSAIDIYKSNLLKDNPLALLVLGRVYQFGITVDVDLALAKQYLQSSASKGNVYARRDLSLIFKKEGKSFLGLVWKLKALVSGLYLGYTADEHDFRIREF